MINPKLPLKGQAAEAGDRFTFNNEEYVAVECDFRDACTHCAFERHTPPCYAAPLCDDVAFMTPVNAVTFKLMGKSS